MSRRDDTEPVEDGGDPKSRALALREQRQIAEAARLEDASHLASLIQDMQLEGLDDVASLGKVLIAATVKGVINEGQARAVKGLYEVVYTSVATKEGRNPNQSNLLVQLLQVVREEQP